ncbi:cutinase-domain-containing protein [Ophiobolus disseminans]|uniref:Cutinase n=1 Tax=Ophiobolus disseminans TaxID=1469910 RepID=A0A6A6ZGG7_9PLEO|nr:cutinase-domain-containing protein [Ophiobolus disseminans]
MKYTTATAIVLAGMSNALPQFSFPTMPSSGGSGFPSIPSTGGGGSGFPTIPSTGGGGSGFPTIPSMGGGGSGFPTTPSTGGGGTGSGWGSWFPGGSGTGGSTPTTSSAPTTPTQGGSTGGNTGGAGTIGTNCIPQGAGGGSTENGITGKNCCTDMTIIFARGTGEMGNVGTVSGPPMFRAIRQKLGNNRVTVQGVGYPADAAGNASQGGTGGKTMAALVDQALSQCPQTKIIVSGYSQGGMVVHSANPQTPKVAGAVLFGDPMKRSAVGNLPTNKVKQFCGTSDQICGGGGDGGATGGHTSYGSSADAAATFAIQAAGLA